MKKFITTGAVLAASLTGVQAGCTNDGGNYYCNEITGISYQGLGASGSYNKVNSMSSSGSCSSAPQGFSGGFAPFDEEVSIHVRGPVDLKQFAVYMPGSSSSKKAKRSHIHRHAHGHAHAHARREAEEKRDMVIATINGDVVSWENNYFGPSSAAPSAAAAATPASAPAEYIANSPNSPVSSAPAAAATTAAASDYSDNVSNNEQYAAGSWVQKAHYDSASQKASNLAFLNHFGGQGSGVFDNTYGSSLSYASSDACSGSASPQVLADSTLPSNTEVVLMSDAECGSDCGYSRDGTVALHGWGGAQKAFFFEFQMPNDGSNSDVYTNGNMPAIWMLNANIPRTIQYPTASQTTCSCWYTGCGEFDIFEVLAPGDSRAKSTIHLSPGYGSSDYFSRPWDAPIKLGVVMTGSEFYIQVLDDSFDFGSSIDSDTINNIISTTSKHGGSGMSQFDLKNPYNPSN